MEDHTCLITQIAPTFPSELMSRRCQRRSAVEDSGRSCRVSVPEPWFTLRTGTPPFSSGHKQDQQYTTGSVSMSLDNVAMETLLRQGERRLTD